MSREQKIALIRQRLQDWPWAPSFHLPTFYEFVSSPHYLGEAEPTAHQRRAIEDGFGPSAYEWFCTPRSVNALWLCWGKGSGKDLLSAEVLAYAAYCIGHMLNPWSHFGTPLGEAMDCINVAQDQVSARQVFFTRLIRMVRRPCFAGLLSQHGRQSDIGTDVVTFRRHVPHLGYRVELLRLLSLHSRNEAAEGKNTLLWVLDESDALRTADGNRAAEKMLSTLTTSNRFGSRQIGISISYPRESEGFMLTHTATCANLGGRTREWWGNQAPTWEVLPWKVYIPVKKDADGQWREIESEQEIDGTEYWTNARYQLFVPSRGMWLAGRWIEKDAEMARVYRDDPELFGAMYACNPPAAEAAFFSMATKIEECVSPTLTPAAQVEHGITVQQVEGKEYRYVSLNLHELHLRPGVDYFLGGDAGEVNDSFALCLAHVVPADETGGICPRCWIIPERRLAKHYQPKRVPVPPPGPAGPPPVVTGGSAPPVNSARGAAQEPARTPPGPALDQTARRGDLAGEIASTAFYACDHCGTRPDPEQHRFWGVCLPSGRRTLRPRIQRYHANGDPIYETWVNPETGEPEPIYDEVWEPVVVEDLLLEWQPNRARSLPVDFRNVKDMILTLARAGRLAAARFDRWNSTQLIQELREAGIACESKSFTNAEQLVMYRNFKSLVYNHRVRLLPGEERARRQLRMLQMLNTTRIDHPPGGAKDLTDAEALAFQLCCEAAGLVGRIDVGGDPEEQRLIAQITEAGFTDRARSPDAPPGVVEQALRDTPGGSFSFGRIF